MKKEILFACSLLLFFSVVILLGGCKSVKYIPIETVTHDTIKQISIDTIQHYERDSVIIETKGDTVFKTAWRTRIDNIVKIKHDTVKQVKKVDIPVPIPVEEKYPLKSKLTLFMSGMLLGGILAGVIFLLIKFKIL